MDRGKGFQMDDAIYDWRRVRRARRGASARQARSFYRQSSNVCTSQLEGRQSLIIQHSELDVLALGSIFPPYCSVTAKKQLKWVPVLGWFSALD